ncbi:MAG: phosphoribosyl-ATP diphosphatase [Spirochaetes bacterium]|nr:phosphoribosyl-ATP diphosphatase [Spirochaetota bacterium]
MENNIFYKLASVIDERKNASPESSYTAKLLHAGVEKISKKVIEEAFEACLAAHNGDTAHLTNEICDLFYHALVLGASRGVTIDAVAAELTRRFGTSGIDEKASRKQQ